MKEFKGTKGNFSDGHTGWKIDNRETNGTQGFEIHYSDDGECITDHVYTIEDAKLIAAAPELLDALEHFLESENNIKHYLGFDQSILDAIEKGKKAINKAL